MSNGRILELKEAKGSVGVKLRQLCQEKILGFPAENSPERVAT